MNPKDKTWKSNKYRRWIRDRQSCFNCGVSLLNESENYTSHHHGHSGGKNPSDQLLTALCLKCHNEFHFQESKFREKYNVTEEDWLINCVNNLSEYLSTLNVNPLWVCINALQEEIEKVDV